MRLPKMRREIQAIDHVGAMRGALNTIPCRCAGRREDSEALRSSIISMTNGVKGMNAIGASYPRPRGGAGPRT